MGKLLKELILTTCLVLIAVLCASAMLLAVMTYPWPFWLEFAIIIAGAGSVSWLAGTCFGRIFVFYEAYRFNRKRWQRSNLNRSTEHWERFLP